MWYLLYDMVDENSLTHIVIQDVYPYLLGDWKSSSEEALNSSLQASNRVFTHDMVKGYKELHSADTLDELKLLILLEE